MTPAVALSFLAIAAPAGQAPASEVEQPVEEPKPNFVVPILHNTGLMVVMRTTEAVIWPEPFARTEHFGWHYEEAYTKAPVFESWRRPFSWDGDPWYINTIGH